MLELRRLVLLREVHRLGSMAAAARALSYSHSAISQQLALLEHEAGVALLERVGRGVRLTAAGQSLVASTERILAEMERAEADLATTDERLHGELTIGAFATIGRVVLPDVLASLMLEHPDLTVRSRVLPPEEALLALAARSIDLAVIDSYPGLPTPRVGDLHTTRIALDPLRAYLPTGADPDTPPDQLRWAMEPTSTDARHWALHECRAHGFEPDVIAESGDLITSLRLVERGIVAAFLPDMVVRETGVGLVPVKDLPGDRHRSIHVVVRAGAEHRATLVAVRTALEHALGR